MKLWHRQLTRAELYQHYTHEIIGLILSLVFLGAAITIPTSLHIYGTPKLTAKSTSIDSLDQALYFTFSHPIDRTQLQPELQPPLPGTWVFDDFLFDNHFPQTLRFLPRQTFIPGTTYTVNLTNVTSYNGASHTISQLFPTPELPRVLEVTPNNGAILDPQPKIRVSIDHANIKGVRWELVTDGTITWRLSEQEGTNLTFVPESGLAAGATYSAELWRQTVSEDLETGEVLSLGERSITWSGTWSVPPPPGLAAINPHGTDIPLREPLVLTFTQPMDQSSVEAARTLTPEQTGEWRWSDEKTLTFTPKDTWLPGTTYQVDISRAARNTVGEPLTDPISHTFTTIGPIRVTGSSPGRNSQGVAVSSALRITLNQALTANQIDKLEISPPVTGSPSAIGTTLTLAPTNGWQPNTTYTVTLPKGLQGIYGILEETYSFHFTTVYTTTQIPVPFFYQARALSCEAAALRMALAAKGQFVAEETLIQAVGFDPTPHTDGIWGDPHEAFVGDVDGEQMSTGYGVYWNPIARAGNAWRSSQAFSGWTLNQVLSEIDQGNPVIVWGYYGTGQGTTWLTPSGKEIYAIKGEHTRVVTGYVGPKDNPQWILVHDPLSGSGRWRPSAFVANWQSLGRSGVVVR